MSDPAEPARDYPAPKRAILLLLKRRPSVSLAEVAESLGVSKVAALRHLSALEADRLVEREYRPAGVGRPRAHFRLTEGAARLFPQAYGQMSMCALSFIEERLGRPAVVELLRQRADEVYAQNASRLQSGDLGSRVRELAHIRDEGGYMAVVGPARANRRELLEHNCPILSLASKFPEACEVERSLFRHLLRADVEVSHRVVAGDDVCRFVIRPTKEGA